MRLLKFCQYDFLTLCLSLARVSPPHGFILTPNTKSSFQMRNQSRRFSSRREKRKNKKNKHDIFLFPVDSKWIRKPRWSRECSCVQTGRMCHSSVHRLRNATGSESRSRSFVPPDSHTELRRVRAEDGS